MNDITDKEFEAINNLADRLLDLVMNADMEDPASAIAALGHVAAMISVEAKMPQQAFLMCMSASYQTIIHADKNNEVH
jgi:hypothetical protein